MQKISKTHSINNKRNANHYDFLILLLITQETHTFILTIMIAQDVTIVVGSMETVALVRLVINALVVPFFVIPYLALMDALGFTVNA